MKKTAAALMFALASMQLAVAQKPSVVTSNEEGWQKIGETTVSFKEEDESIVVLGADEFSSLKLRVTDAPIKIERVQVFYESGDMQELEVESELQAGAETQVFQLNHEDRDIQKVAFTYKTAANTSGDKAHVELHGLKTEIHSQSDAYRNDRDSNNNVEQTVDSVGNEIEQGANDVGNSVDSVREETQEAAEGIKNEMDTAANDASNYLERKAEDADSAVNQAGQELNDSAENVEDNVERGADRVGNEIERTSEEAADDVSETTANTASGMTDKVVKNMEGPERQKIYMDNQSKYYYINDEGKKVIIAKDQLKTKKID